MNAPFDPSLLTTWKFAVGQPVSRKEDLDALSEFGITNIDRPATPYRIWQAIQAAKT
jgi:hypothetical protein